MISDTIHTAPAEFAWYALVGDVIVFLFCLVFFSAWLGSDVMEE